MIALHLLRHAHAGDPDKWPGDDDLRPLSEKGIRQSERLGRVLAGLDEAPDLFLTSPLLRASQTAEIVAGAVGAPVVVDERLADSLDIDVLTGILRTGDGAARAARPCLVGHDPDFSELLAALVGVAEITIRKGAIARVDLEELPARTGAGVLRYLVPPELLPGK